MAPSDALVAYRTYPHIDLAATGARCLPLIERLLAGRRAGQGVAPDRLPDPAALAMHDHRARPLALCAAGRGGGRAGLASASICMGFPAADTPVCGPSVLAYAVDAAPAERRSTAGRRRSRRPSRASPAGCGRPRRRSRTPCGRAGPAGHPGGHAGQSGRRRQLGHDGPARGADRGPRRGRAAGAAVRPGGRGGARGGEGGRLQGWRSAAAMARPGVRPLVGDFEVLRLGSGRFTATGPMYGGNRMDLGPMALLRSCAAPGVEVAVRRGGCRRPTGRSCIIWASTGRHARSWRSRARCISARTSRPWPRRCSWSRPGANIADPAELPFRLVPAGRCGAGPVFIARYGQRPVCAAAPRGVAVALSSSIVNVTSVTRRPAGGLFACAATHRYPGCARGRVADLDRQRTVGTWPQQPRAKASEPLGDRRSPAARRRRDRARGWRGAALMLASTIWCGDENGEVVLFNDSGLRALAVSTDAAVVEEAGPGAHMTAAGRGRLRVPLRRVRQRPQALLPAGPRASWCTTTSGLELKRRAAGCPQSRVEPAGSGYSPTFFRRSVAAGCSQL